MTTRDMEVTTKYQSISSEKTNFHDMESKTLQATIVPSRGRVTGRLMLAVLYAVMGSLCFGYNTGVINVPEKNIKDFVNKTDWDRSGSPASSDRVTCLYALIVAIFAVGGCVGGILAGAWSNFFGRKHGMAISAVVGVVGAALMYFSKQAAAYEMIIVGRLVIGFSSGLYTGLTPMYLSEVSSLHIRGALGVLHQLGVVCGILLSQILGFPEILGTDDYWEILLGLTIVPCVVQLLLLPVCPESPRFLLIAKEQEEEARRVLRMLRGTDVIDDDIQEMKAEACHTASEPKIRLQDFVSKKSLRTPLIISIVMQLSQQLSGINGIFYYSSSLFKGAGLEEDTAIHATSGVGAVMVSMTLVTIPLMDRLGRRTLHMVGLGGMFLFSILITLTLALKDEVEGFKIGSIVVSLIFVVFFALGPGSIPWLIVAELFAQGPRSVAISVSVLVNWVANFIVGYSFPFIQKGLGDYTFLPFTVFLLLFAIFTFVYLPETKGRTIEDITMVWRAKEDKSAPPFKEDENKAAASRL
ncbi:glucose transporter type 1-like isoform X1 [Pomacea canaliculata]|uniref:glucose transporter type 1-like isoform X1 n=2 Tax=Pomacea canaliculata TaxID=400727 RepID=UPI000D72C92A|nr:glucose transporter type 1-like isoform X1 [Pomacea canaliculata]